MVRKLLAISPNYSLIITAMTNTKKLLISVLSLIMTVGLLSTAYICQSNARWNAFVRCTNIGDNGGDAGCDSCYRAIYGHSIDMMTGARIIDVDTSYSDNVRWCLRCGDYTFWQNGECEECGCGKVSL